MTDKKFRVGFIGVGLPWKTEGATGFGMANQHADGYNKLPNCELVACADLKESTARAFAEKHGVANIYTDAEKMLADENLDIVSISTWPDQHAPLTIQAAKAGVKAIHCEKPMAPNWADAQEMARVCAENDVRLTFNHQRRTLAPFQTARAQIQAGAIGDLLRIEGRCGDMLDWGTHWLDMFFFYNGETPAEWVLGQIDVRRERKIFGVPLETQAVCEFKFTNGVHALLMTGGETNDPVAHRLIGTNGLIEVRNDTPQVRVLNGDGWKTFADGDDLHGPNSVERAIAEIVDALETGRESILDAQNALRATEVIFATYESSRRRARIDLPLTTPDNAFLAMLEGGVIGIAE